MHKSAKWILHTKRADFNTIAKRFHITPVMARIIRNRDVVEETDITRYLYGTVSDLFPPRDMTDMERAVSILIESIKTGQRIRIVGDYDIDGICATYLLYKGIVRCGGQVDYMIPERIRDGYGINESIIRTASQEGIQTIITCDNGIAAADQITLAKELGMTVVVTDHHEVPRGEAGQKLPPAEAIVNPKREDCFYPFDGICGGVVAYKLVQVLYEEMGIPSAEWEEMLEFAAIATVGDVMKLQNENRIIVRLGLKQMERTHSIGLRKLVEACGLELGALSAYHIGFVIGPCLNASGRLQTARMALELLLCEEEDRAATMAAELQLLNEERKTLTGEAVKQAHALVEEKYQNDDVLVVYLPECHESLAGIIAGRLRETWHRPSFVLTKGEEGVKGSGRSIEAYSMYEALCQVKDLLAKFGGHPMAAGFSLPEEHVEEFRRRLNENSNLKEEDFVPRIWIDVPMPLEYISQELVQELRLLEPFGQGNEKPQFAQKNLKIRSARVIGRNQNAVKLSLMTEKGAPMEGLLFTDGTEFLSEKGSLERIDIVYYPEINTYGGNQTLQVIIKDYQLHD